MRREDATFKRKKKKRKKGHGRVEVRRFSIKQYMWIIEGRKKGDGDWMTEYRNQPRRRKKGNKKRGRRENQEVNQS